MRRFTTFIKQHPYSLAFFAFCTTFCIILITFALLGYAPFGDNSIAVGDASIQYLDFFAFLRRVLTGKESLLFTFTKGLGGSALALFAYYLASPLNLLLAFFEAGNVDIFLSLIFALKTALCSATLCIFLIWCFRHQLDQTPTRLIFVYLLSLGYGTCQYVLSQSSNIMWLDGVYMLPLMMLGASQLAQGKSGLTLGVTAGLSILFNWYTGGINCLFIILWFIFELIPTYPSQPSSWSPVLRKLSKFILVMSLAVMTSAVLFIPSVFAILGSSHGSLALSSLIKPLFIGSPFSIIDRYTIGASSEIGFLSVFCGALALLGAIMFFISRQVKTRTKIIFGTLLAILFLTCFFQPLITLFSLLEVVYSYWYRYSYIIIATLLFISATYFIKYFRRDDSSKLYRTGIIAALVILAVNYFSPNLARDNWYYTRAWFTAIILMLVTVLVIGLYRRRATFSSRTKYILSITLCAAIIIESFLEAGSFIRTFRSNTVSSTHSYTNETAQLLQQLESSDSSTYRISQTTTKQMDSENKTANYNESLAYGYKSITTYTSTVDDAEIALLDRLGYRADYEIKNIVNTSIIGSDSLLGVKYIMSPYPINGLIPTDIASTISDKKVYRNPYALPLALVYNNNDLEINYHRNPFTYQNEIYSKLLGKKVELYKPLKYQLVQSGNVEGKQAQRYTIDIPKGNYAVYGQIFPTDHNWDMILDVNGIYQTAYARDITPIDGSLSPSVFYIPTTGKAEQITITLKSNESYHLENGTEQFYALDLDLLEKVTSALKQQSPELTLRLDNGYVEANVQAKSNQSIYLSVAEDQGWTIWRNGEKITPDLIADALYSIPLVEGDNHIELKYQVPGFTLGVTTSCLGIIGLVLLGLYERRH